MWLLRLWSHNFNFGKEKIIKSCALHVNWFQPNDLRTEPINLEYFLTFLNTQDRLFNIKKAQKHSPVFPGPDRKYENTPRSITSHFIVLSRNRIKIYNFRNSKGSQSIFSGDIENFPVPPERQTRCFSTIVGNHSPHFSKDLILSLFSPIK